MCPLTLIEQLKLNNDSVNKFILDFLPKRDKVNEIQNFYDMMRDYPSRPGKGLRSSLCILTCETFGGEREKAIRTAAALEVFQNWILIHDDIEDSSEMRRGEPVLHQKYGMPMAINIGDALHAKMWDVLMNNQKILGQSKTFELVNEFLRMINETTEGQHIELSWVKDKRWTQTEEDYYRMVNKKTSWYTCISPIRLGAIIADVEKSNLDALIPFGSILGTAFQIQDDILNLRGDEKKYGKEQCGDIMEGKRTLMLIHLLNKSDPKDKEKILKIMNKSRNKRTPSEVNEILKFMDKYGTIDYAKTKAEKYALEAKKQFNKIFLTKPSIQSKTLEELIDFMVQREW